MARIPARIPGLALTAALVAVLAHPAVPVADDSLADAATLVRSRWGTTTRGATRVVFQLDRQADYLTIELADDDGVEVHLLGAEAEPLPSPMPVGSGGVRDVTFRPGPSGVVARIAGSGTPLTARTFKLDNPPRVVVDLTQDGGSGDVPAPRVEPTGTAVTKSARADTPSVTGDVTRSDDESAGSIGPDDEDDTDTFAAASPAPSPDAAAAMAPAEPATPESAAVADADGPFQDLVAWIAGLKLDANALKLSETEEERSRYRRSLAFLLAERGLVHEAVTVLTSALASGHGDRGTAFADSLYLAELRLETGDVEGAAGIAQELSSGEQTPQQRIRLARILQRCDFPDLAVANLEEVLPRLVGEPRVEAQMLLARAYWDRKDVEKARQYVSKLTASGHVSPELRGGALILEADCAWAQGRTQESERLYRRALQETLDDEEASWVTLQLGNAARRNGRLADAIDHYRDARDRWPDTFYGAQADWFLRIAEQTERLANAEALRDRG